MTIVIHDMEKGFFAGFQMTPKGRIVTWSPNADSAMRYSKDDGYLIGALKRVRLAAKTATTMEI